MANLTLVDPVNPTAQEAIYLRATQALEIINDNNRVFNILEFDPEHMGSDSYQGDAVRIEKQYYYKIQSYIDDLFERNPQWESKIGSIGQFIYN